MKKLRLLFFVFGALMLFGLSTSAAHAQEPATTNDKPNQNTSAGGRESSVETSERISVVESTKTEIVKQESNSNTQGGGTLSSDNDNGVSSKQLNNQSPNATEVTLPSIEPDKANLVETKVGLGIANTNAAGKIAAAKFIVGNDLYNVQNQNTSGIQAAPNLSQTDNKVPGTKLPYSVPGSDLLLTSAIGPAIIGGVKFLGFGNPLFQSGVLLFIGFGILLGITSLNNQDTWIARLKKSRFKNAARSDLASINFENEPLIRSTIFNNISRLFSCFVFGIKLNHS